MIHLSIRELTSTRPRKQFLQLFYSSHEAYIEHMHIYICAHALPFTWKWSLICRNHLISIEFPVKGLNLISSNGGWKPKIYKASSWVMAGRFPAPIVLYNSCAVYPLIAQCWCPVDRFSSSQTPFYATPHFFFYSFPLSLAPHSPPVCQQSEDSNFIPWPSVLKLHFVEAAVFLGFFLLLYFCFKSSSIISCS